MIVLVPSYMAVPFNYYYSNLTDKTFEFGANNSTDLEKINLLKGNNSIFYIVTGDISAMNSGGDAIAWLTRKTHETERTGIYLSHHVNFKRIIKGNQVSFPCIKKD